MIRNLKSKIENLKYEGSPECAGAGGQSNQMTVGGEQKAVSSKNAEAVLFAPLFYGGTAAEKVLRIKPLISLRLSRYSDR